MMLYPIAEIFRSIQGEGIDVGLPAIFVRFSGCNLHCSFCDTDHTANYSMVESQVADTIERLAVEKRELVVLTGGEPALQDLMPLVKALQGSSREYRFGIETNGTVDFNQYLFDSISLSPKTAPEKCVLKSCHSLKLLFPFLPGCSPDEWVGFCARHRFIQPIDGKPDSVRQAFDWVRDNGGSTWRLGLQIHKFVKGAR